MIPISKAIVRSPLRRGVPGASGRKLSAQADIPGRALAACGHRDGHPDVRGFTVLLTAVERRAA
ncbi:hypothetical protein [Actinomadura geliboluensis]|uniref:hypothetical protein n=1 Tax=Actinomadura geliboluensis TaxID=882440 RepID=UPI0036CE3B3F